MKIDYAGAAVRIADGGHPGDSDEPLVVLLHGAGMDRTAWQLQTRYLAHHGYRAAAVDLPGHGRSGGSPLSTIAEMAAWTAGLVDALGASTAHLVGHSMGSFIALEAAATFPEVVESLVLLGTAAAMPVHPDLLEASTRDVLHASALMASWGFSPSAHIGQAASPGLWLIGGTQALVDSAPGGSLAADLAACNRYADAAVRAAAVRCPVTLVTGTADKMTPPRAARELIEAFASPPTVVVLDGVGHMMMTESPDRVREAIVAALEPGRDPAS